MNIWVRFLSTHTLLASFERDTNQRGETPFLIVKKSLSAKELIRRGEKIFPVVHTYILDNPNISAYGTTWSSLFNQATAKVAERFATPNINYFELWKDWFIKKKWETGAWDRCMD